MQIDWGDLWRSSALIQGTMALGYSAVIWYLSIANREIPGILVAILGTIVGYYFGVKKTTTPP